MGRNTQHVVAGIEAVIDSAYVAGHSDIWVNTDDLLETLRQIRKLSNNKYPKVYPAGEGMNISDTEVCVRI